MRFVANNPGVWYLHCHIMAHLTMGMGFVVIVDPDKIGAPTDSAKYCDKNLLQANVTADDADQFTNINEEEASVLEEEGFPIDDSDGLALSWGFCIVAIFLSSLTFLI